MCSANVIMRCDGRLPRLSALVVLPALLRRFVFKLLNAFL